MGLGRERIALLSESAERHQLYRSLAAMRNDDRDRQLLQQARRRLNAAQARAQ
jgi:hypothetical protein